MTDNEMIKYLRDHGLTNGCSLGHHSGTNDLIADRMVALIEENNRQKAEIESFKKAIEKAAQLNCFLEASRKCVKIEAVKEFAVRLKAKISCYDWVNVDDLVKEVVGEG